MRVRSNCHHAAHFMEGSHFEVVDILSELDSFPQIVLIIEAPFSTPQPHNLNLGLIFAKDSTLIFLQIDDFDRLHRYFYFFHLGGI